MINIEFLEELKRENFTTESLEFELEFLRKHINHYPENSKEYKDIVIRENTIKEYLK